MKLTSVLWRLLLVLAVGFWSVQVLAVAVFAVGDRYSGAQAVFMSLAVLVGGFLPVVLLGYLFRQPLGLTGLPAGVTPSAVGTAGRDTPDHVERLVEPISERELEVLSLVARGHSNKEIARELSVTVGTVKTHTNNINRKLGTSSRTQAIARARQLDLI